MITLQSMTQAEFQRFLEPAIIEYAQGHIEDGRWSMQEAVEKSRQEFQELLPQGVATPDHYLFTLVNEEQQHVGMLWFAKQESAGQPGAFVYEIRIDEQFQRHGYASLAFSEMERKVRALGWNRISLHVFGNNHGARQMYRKLGYEETNVLMAKTLDAL